MKKELWLFGLMILPAVFTYGTSRAQNSGDFYDSLLISDELKTEENAEEAKDSAGRLLDAKPMKSKLIRRCSVLIRKNSKKPNARSWPKRKTRLWPKTNRAPSAWRGGRLMTKSKKKAYRCQPSDRKTTSITSAPRIFPKASKPSVKSFSLSASKTNSGG